jgi:hypothetical protein
MRFDPFRRRGARPATPGDEAAAQPGEVKPDEWVDSGVAEEVSAFISGRYVEFLVSAGRSVPGWAALNRLAHADHRDLVRVMAGAAPGGPMSRRRYAWAEQERIMAAQLLATKGSTPAALTRAQQQALVPVELSLIDRVTPERLGTEDVLQEGADALEDYHAGA